MGVLDSIFNPDKKKNQALIDKTLAQQQKLRKEGNKEFRSAYGQGIDYLGDANVAFEDLSDRADAPLDWRELLMYGGDEGVDAFNNSPLKRLSLEGANQGLQALERHRIPGGQTGQLSMDAMNFMSNQNRDIWQQLIQSSDPYFNMAGQGAQGQASNYTNMANLGMQRASGISGNNVAMLPQIQNWGAAGVANNGLGMQNALNFALGLGNAAGAYFGGKA